jgi:hypothetical protein
MIAQKFSVSVAFSTGVSGKKNSGGKAYDYHSQVQVDSVKYEDTHIG